MLTREDDHATQLAAVVVIGRNEGARLAACLASVVRAGQYACYVDSGSRDGSVELARGSVDLVLPLAADRPYCAARARNEGLQFLLEHQPGLEYVQFLDGDCELAPAWIPAGRARLETDVTLAAAFGHLRERSAAASPYNRLCALEWRSPAGRITNCAALGGNMLVRISAFRRVGGFDPNIIAGEDSEFGVRLGLAGFAIEKLDEPMATHDADMHSFAQWWRRAVRSGHAIGQRASLHGDSPARDCVRERRSVLFWGLCLPVAILVLLPVTRGLSLLLLAAYCVLGWRIHAYRRSTGDTVSEAWLYARFTVLGKFAEAWGLLKFTARRRRGVYTIIEHRGT